MINFDLPAKRVHNQTNRNDKEGGSCWADLVHRIGRAGRFGSKAMAVNFVSE